MKFSFFTLCLVALMTAGTSLAGDGIVHAHARHVPDSFIVILDDQSSDGVATLDQLSRAFGAKVTMVFDHVFRGAEVRMPPQAAAALARDPRVRRVEENALIESASYTQQIDAPYTYTPLGGVGVSIRPQWWLDRLDQVSASLPALNLSYSYDFDGTGARVYVVDTGIQWKQSEFNSVNSMYPPATWRDSKVDPADSLKARFLGLDPTYSYPSGYVVRRFLRAVETDEFGNVTTMPPNYAAGSHGTAVASIICGRTNGVAKNARVVDVQWRSADSTRYGAGDAASLLMALNWIPDDPNWMIGRPALVNMSMSVPPSDDPTGAIPTAINSLSANHNLTFFVAAGNEGGPTSVNELTLASRSIVVGGMTTNDRFLPMSNYGLRVNFYAAGELVNAASFSGERKDTIDCFTGQYPGDHGCLDGTSFSAPVGAGVGALTLQRLKEAGCPTITRYEILNGWTSPLGAYYEGMVGWSSHIAPIQITDPSGVSKPLVQVYLARRRPS